MTGPLTEKELAHFAAEVAEARRSGSWPDRGDYDVLVRRLALERVPALLDGLLAAQEALRQIEDFVESVRTMGRADLAIDASEGALDTYDRMIDDIKGFVASRGALLGVSAEPLKDTERATASQSPVAEEGREIERVSHPAALSRIEECIFRLGLVGPLSVAEAADDEYRALKGALVEVVAELEPVLSWLDRFETDDDAIDEDESWDTALLASAKMGVQIALRAAVSAEPPAEAEPEEGT